MKRIQRTTSLWMDSAEYRPRGRLQFAWCIVLSSHAQSIFCVRCVVSRVSVTTAVSCHPLKANVAVSVTCPSCSRLTTLTETCCSHHAPTVSTSPVRMIEFGQAPS